MLPRMDSIARVGSIPIVESALGCSGKYYSKLKGANALTKWYFVAVETSVATTLNLATPAISLFSGPISVIDGILCKSLDALERRIPSAYLPPEMIYSNTREYVTCKLVKPVLSRADSVKHMGEAMLESRVTVYAVDRLDDALDRADLYVDKYLPDEVESESDQQQQQQHQQVPESESGSRPRQGQGKDKALHAIQHVDRLTRKLQRRITRRTLLEARALHHHTTEAIHVLAYVAELIVTDPKLAVLKAGELWKVLSGDEPENQARPTNLEELLVMLTRESARRLVHLTNFTVDRIYGFPSVISQYFQIITHQMLVVVNFLVEKAHLNCVKELLLKDAVVLFRRMESLSLNVQCYSKTILEEIALLIAGNFETEKLQMPNRSMRNNHRYLNENNPINGVY